MDPALTAALERLVDPDARGDPGVAVAVDDQVNAAVVGGAEWEGHRASEWLVPAAARGRLQPAGGGETDRGHPASRSRRAVPAISTTKCDNQSAEQPVISVDTKKKELVGRYKNAGGELATGRSPSRLHTTTSRTKELGKAIPYGVYDLAADAGWVSVGADHDTAAFAVATIRRWWQASAPTATRMRRGC